MERACSKCGALNSANNRYCKTCGSPMVDLSYVSSRKGNWPKYTLFSVTISLLVIGIIIMGLSFGTWITEQGWPLVVYGPYNEQVKPFQENLSGFNLMTHEDSSVIRIDFQAKNDVYVGALYTGVWTLIFGLLVVFFSLCLLLRRRWIFYTAISMILVCFLVLIILMSINSANINGAETKSHNVDLDSKETQRYLRGTDPNDPFSFSDYQIQTFTPNGIIYSDIGYGGYFRVDDSVKIGYAISDVRAASIIGIVICILAIVFGFLFKDIPSPM